MVTLSYDLRSNFKISTVKDHKLCFNGIIKWERGRNSIMWQSYKGGKGHRAIFGPGDDASANKSFSAILAFVNNKGRRQQFLLFEKQLTSLYGTAYHYISGF